MSACWTLAGMGNKEQGMSDEKTDLITSSLIFSSHARSLFKVLRKMILFVRICKNTWTQIEYNFDSIQATRVLKLTHRKNLWKS